MQRVTDGKSYNAYRIEWKTIYNHLSGMIKAAKMDRREAAKELGRVAHGLAVAVARMPNSDARRRRIERFQKDMPKAQLSWHGHQLVCLALRKEAREMMEHLEDTKARRPPRKARG